MKDIKVHRSINIKGLVCPFTFVKAKLAMEELEVGQVLEVVLDYEEASRSIPRSMEEQGQKVLWVEKVSETDWVLVIRKEAD